LQGLVRLGQPTLTINSSGNYTFNGVISSGLSLAKIRLGTQTLTNANTYTGTTTVNGGALLVNGSLAAGSTVTVNSAGTLGGGGTINGPVWSLPVASSRRAQMSVPSAR